MEDILKTLRHEHKNILLAIDELLEIKEGCLVGTKSLEKLEHLILSHIAREDTQIYIPLKRLVKLSPEAEKFLDTSRHKLEDVKIMALVFFEKFKGEQSQIFCDAFRRDFERLAKKIRERMEIEDEELFPFLNNIWAKL